MIVGAPPLVATMLPAADIAMWFRVGIDFLPAMVFYRTPQSVPHLAVIGRIVVHSEDLRLVVGPGRDDIRILRRQPLHRGNELGIKTELQHGAALGLAGKLGVYYFI